MELEVLEVPDLQPAGLCATQTASVMCAFASSCKGPRALPRRHGGGPVVEQNGRRLDGLGGGKVAEHGLAGRGKVRQGVGRVKLHAGDFWGGRVVGDRRRVGCGGKNSLRAGFASGYIRDFIVSDSAAITQNTVRASFVFWVKAPAFLACVRV